MGTQTELLPAGQVLAEVERLLDRVDSDRSGLDDAARLSWVRVARRVRGRVEALAAVLVMEADRAQASVKAVGTPMKSWLGMGETLSRREASGALGQARAIGGRAVVGEAAVAGRVGTGQARAIIGVLDGLSDRLDGAQQAAAEKLLVELASHLDTDQLAQSVPQVLAHVAPARADELLEERLQRQAEAAQRQRSLRFFREGASIRFDGSLPRVEAEAWMSQLDRLGEARRRTRLERRDPLAEWPTPAQRRADALIAMIHDGGTGGESGRRTDGPAPSARVLVRLDFAQLRAAAAGAGVLTSGEALSAGELRRVCCDAELIPVVLGSASQVLDVGRAERLVDPGLRAALIARDGGCVFPGCDAPPGVCEAHHAVPWWLGGATALKNLIMLCHSHHPVVEPARLGIRDQWQARVAEDGLPEFIPPARLDPERRPIRHQRHQRRSLDPGGRTQ